MDGIVAIVLWVFLGIIVITIIASTIRIVPQSRAYVVERIGAYNRTCNVGLHILIPFFDRVANKVSLKEQVVDFAPQPVITKDNVTMQIDTVYLGCGSTNQRNREFNSNYIKKYYWGFRIR